MKNLGSESPTPLVANTSDTISLGLGLTNECNLACAFCYRDPARTDRLTLEQVKSVMERLPVRSVNLGTGENGMHPEFKAILAYLHTQPVKLVLRRNLEHPASLAGLAVWSNWPPQPPSLWECGNPCSVRVPSSEGGAGMLR